MKFTLVSVSLAAALVLGAGSLSAKAASVGAGLTALQADASLIQKAHYDDDDRRGSWRHYRVDNDRRDGGYHGWWRYHRVDRDDDRHHVWRDRNDRSDRDDHRWR
jgi:hypothetical protein